mmetsp:Transcript_2703/g.5767  ORF Transcript_2703/g.5767 Transcript_2703/m.5767 type:complete len:204 (-) Transcript_2703:225-836(-)
MSAAPGEAEARAPPLHPNRSSPSPRSQASRGAPQRPPRIPPASTPCPSAPPPPQPVRIQGGQFDRQPCCCQRPPTLALRRAPPVGCPVPQGPVAPRPRTAEAWPAQQSHGPAMPPAQPAPLPQSPSACSPRRRNSPQPPPSRYAHRPASPQEAKGTPAFPPRCAAGPRGSSAIPDATPEIPDVSRRPLHDPGSFPRRPLIQNP